MSKLPLRIVQLSDLHLFAGPQGSLLNLRTRECFGGILQLVEKGQQPYDMIILTGDLSQDESSESYHYLVKQLQLFSCPIYWIPGNHDSLAIMEPILATSHLLPDKELHIANWSILLLNSADPGKVPGYLAATELKRLEQFIHQYSHQHLLIILHHQPIPVGSAWLDGVGLRNYPELLQLLDTSTALRGVVFGHVHQEFDQVYKGVRYLASPSTCIQFLPKSDKFALHNIAPGYRYIELHADGTIYTQVHRLAHFSADIDWSAPGY